MNIKVVNRNGQSILLPKSFLRYTILGIPFFLNGALIPLTVQMSPLFGMISLLTLGISGVIIYLYIFNRETRQSFHDLITGTYVVQSSISSPIPVIGVRKIHLIVISIWFLVVLIFSTVTPQIQKTEPFHGLLAVCNSVQNSGKIKSCKKNTTSVKVNVVDKITGNPIGNAIVYLGGTGASGRCYSNRKGKCLIRDIHPTFSRFVNRENNIFDKPNRESAKCAFVNHSI